MARGAETCRNRQGGRPLAAETCRRKEVRVLPGAGAGAIIDYAPPWTGFVGGGILGPEFSPCWGGRGIFRRWGGGNQFGAVGSKLTDRGIQSAKTLFRQGTSVLHDADDTGQFNPRRRTTDTFNPPRDDETRAKRLIIDLALGKTELYVFSATKTTGLCCSSLGFIDTINTLIYILDK